MLRGHFSFDMPPTALAGSIYSRMVTVSKDVAISGRHDANGEMPIIDGGDWPFLINAGTPVSPFRDCTSLARCRGASSRKWILGDEDWGIA